LSGRPWETGVHEHDSRPRLLWGLRAGVHQVECLFQPSHTAAAGVLIGQRQNMLGLDSRRAGECVEMLNGFKSWQMPAEIECGPLDCCDSHVVDLDHLVACKPLVATDDARRRITVLPDQLDWCRLPNPRRTV
jgi:hypothetical protein